MVPRVIDEDVDRAKYRWPRGQTASPVPGRRRQPARPPPPYPGAGLRRSGRIASSAPRSPPAPSRWIQRDGAPRPRPPVRGLPFNPRSIVHARSSDVLANPRMARHVRPSVLPEKTALRSRGAEGFPCTGMLKGGPFGGPVTLTYTRSPIDRQFFSISLLTVRIFCFMKAPLLLQVDGTDRMKTEITAVGTQGRSLANLGGLVLCLALLGVGLCPPPVVFRI